MIHAVRWSAANSERDSDEIQTILKLEIHEEMLIHDRLPPEPADPEPPDLPVLQWSQAWIQIMQQQATDFVRDLTILLQVWYKISWARMWCSWWSYFELMPDCALRADATDLEPAEPVERDGLELLNFRLLQL